MKEEKLLIRNFYFPMNALRICFLNNKGRIICEYDFMQRRLISRREALSRYEWKKTLKRFGLESGMEIPNLDRAKRPKSLFFISDLHLDHSNIIKYCTRPFLFYDVREMNEVLVRNWNSVVKKDDTIYFLGDLVFGRGSHSIDYWLRQFDGNIIFVKGVHDRINGKSCEILNCRNYRFLLIHNPDEIPAKWMAG
jgi:hypothetical protein